MVGGGRSMKNEPWHSQLIRAIMWLCNPVALLKVSSHFEGVYVCVWLLTKSHHFPQSHTKCPLLTEILPWWGMMYTDNILKLMLLMPFNESWTNHHIRWSINQFHNFFFKVLKWNGYVFKVLMNTSYSKVFDGPNAMFTYSRKYHHLISHKIPWKDIKDS